jgi:DNA-binding transcriptional MocR family regulator
VESAIAAILRACPLRGGLRLTFAGEPPERMAEGVARLASVL